jgi:hypothetical protein
MIYLMAIKYKYIYIVNRHMIMIATLVFIICHVYTRYIYIAYIYIIYVFEMK